MESQGETASMAVRRQWADTFIPRTIESFTQTAAAPLDDHLAEPTDARPYDSIGFVANWGRNPSTLHENLTSSLDVEADVPNEEETDHNGEGEKGSAPEDKDMPSDTPVARQLEATDGSKLEEIDQFGTIDGPEVEEIDQSNVDFFGIGDLFFNNNIFVGTSEGA